MLMGRLPEAEEMSAFGTMQLGTKCAHLYAGGSDSGRAPMAKGPNEHIWQIRF